MERIMNGMYGILLLSTIIVSVYCQTTASENFNDCWSNPCLNGGTCNDLDNGYNCTCPHLFNGTRCGNDLSVYGCTVLPCLNGGTCLDQNDGSRNYKCSCVTGFNGVNCETSINECASGPCKHGRCIDGINSYSCDCNGTGFTGITCENDIDECSTGQSVCGTGTCFNNEGSFTCQCPRGYDGPNCQNNINDCSSSPCLHGGTCSDGVASYTCNCAIGYEGNNCQNNTDDCKNVQCTGQNTICVDGINSHSCECKPGFTGSPGNCIDIDECNPDPCRNGATCQNLENAYNCLCPPGYTGGICQSDINECATNPCKHGALCTDLVNSYRCDCLPGYTGTDCETDINECVLNNQPCRNGATCQDLINNYSCNCSAGWTGQHCQSDIDDCSPNPCKYGATCHNYQNYYNCTCLPGYTGKNCETNIDDCTPNPCQHGSTCQDLVNGYYCNCSEGWMGKNCSDEYDACSFAPCKNGATCSTTKPQRQYSCACVLGYTGHDCETDIEDCRHDSCQYPFVCFDLVNNFTCACKTGYKGENCSEEINECESNPCKNGGTCTDSVGNYTCQCDQIFVNLTKYGNGQKLEFLTGYTGTNCEVDIKECSLRPSICLNNGTCESTSNGGYRCLCGPDEYGIYTAGKHCELRTSYCDASEIVKKDPPACKNGGTCISGDRSFSCICAPGFTGPRCETDINECESSPCRYDGNCTDQVNGYICDCIPGITGPNCETDINECASTPCENGGQCQDRINGYECNCTDTGFNGTECQFNIDDCAILLPCQNNASCTDLVKDYKCNCFPGYEGKDCEIDIDECMSNPCDYNGTCTQRSLQNQPDFSYFTAAGYDCSCIPGITGVNCEINIDECVNNTCQFGSTCVDQINGYTCKCAPGYRGVRCQIEIDECAENLPCRNGASCKDKVADYDCICPEFFGGKQYGGKNCTVELTSCLSNECRNGATCKPYLINEATNQQSFTCACQNGYTGNHCEIPTTMSFNNDSYIKHSLSKVINNTISFRFRTTLANGLLFAWDGNFVTSTLFCTVELYNGMLYVTYPTGEGNNAVTMQANFPFLLNDADWHEVEIVQSSMLSFELKSSKCTSNCKVAYSYTEGAPTNTTWFGKLNSEFKTQKTISKSNLIGCMEDINMNALVLTKNKLNTPTTNSVNVDDGCPRTEQCFPNSCNRRGTCIDLWNNYRCDCMRPHHGNDCEKDFTPATFAEGETTSWTSFDIASLKSTLRTNIDISLFIRSRETEGLIMFLGNQGTTYITLELYQGYILSRVICDNYKQAFFLNQTLFNDGEQHLARITKKDDIFTLHIDAFSVSDTMQVSCDLIADYLYFGGRIPDSLSAGRRKRATEFTINVESISDLSAVGKYKGTIQDIELNSEKLMFYSEPSISGILANNVTSLKQGEVTDDICSSLPCENNGTCANVFFNDFNCTCPHGFIGKNCSELDFCKDQSCPVGAECHTLSDGFECISTATFSGGPVNPTVLSYTRHIKSNHLVDEILLKFRTIVRNGHIMFIKNQDGRYIEIGLDGGNIVVTSGLDSLTIQSITVDLFVGDNSWYTALLKQSDRDLTLTVTGSTQVSKSILLSVNAISLQTLINYGTSSPLIHLGVTSMLSSPAHHYYSGCLREVRIGGLLLPFYQQSAFKNFTTSQYFAAQSISNLQEGCNGGTGCTYNQCQHGTSCLPDYFGYNCNCTGSGYYGNWCETNVNNCEANICNQGKCVDKVNDFYCKCPTGYSGTRCETVADACNPDPCQNNASCQRENGGFTCTCPSSHVGQTCDVSATSTCSQSPCKNGAGCQDLTNATPSFNCTCPAGFRGDVCDISIDKCKDFPCLNGGNCTSTSTDYQCSCPSGFSGKKCSTNNNDCKAGICQHGGTCIDIVNGYICNCTENWDGSRCEHDVDECKRQPCERGTCQNTAGSYQCLCDNTGYQGQFCDVDVDECLTTPCQNEGTCLNYDGGYNCTCTTGYKGVNCETPDCNLVNCENGATCVINGANKWQCNCAKYYFGQLCELRGPCTYNPCNNNNTQECLQENKVNSSYSCNCKPGWEGVHCDDDIDECKTPICKNLATCGNTPGGYTCTCLPGYTDKNCSTDIDECATQPCQNNGVCTDQVNDFYCDCNNTGYTNKTCSDDIDECALDDKCINKVKCDNVPGGYICSCVAGYIGKACDKKDPDKQKLSSDDDIMWFIIGPILAVILIAIVVVIIVFVMCARNKRATRGTYSPSRQEVTGSRVELGQVLKPPPEERLI